MCIGCHGIVGYKTAFPEVYSVPKIGGQHAAYIVKALQAYKSGERKHPSMVGVAASLSDKDMADLAAYYSAGPGKVASKVTVLDKKARVEEIARMLGGVKITDTTRKAAAEMLDIK